MVWGRGSSFMVQILFLHHRLPTFGGMVIELMGWKGREGKGREGKERKGKGKGNISP